MWKQAEREREREREREKERERVCVCVCVWLVFSACQPLFGYLMLKSFNQIWSSIMYSKKCIFNTHFKQINTIVSNRSIWPINGTLTDTTTSIFPVYMEPAVRNNYWQYLNEYLRWIPDLKNKKLISMNWIQTVLARFELFFLFFHHQSLFFTLHPPLCRCRAKNPLTASPSDA